MNLETIRQIVPELERELGGSSFGKVFAISRLRYVIDFRLSGGRYLFVSLEPSSSQVFLVRRRMRDLEKQAQRPTAFSASLQKALIGARVEAIDQIEDERVVTIALVQKNEFGELRRDFLCVQLTGRSANLFVLDATRRISLSLRATNGDGQQIGDVYSPPQRQIARAADSGTVPKILGNSLSEALDLAFLESENHRRLRELESSARSRLAKEKTRLTRLREKLDADLNAHGDADQWKLYGDLLLANAATATRSGQGFVVIDYFDPTTPQIEISASEQDGLTETAEKYFKKYAKARNAASEIERRRSEIETDLARIEDSLTLLDAAAENEDEDALRAFAGVSKTVMPAAKRAPASEIDAIARRFISSDGFDILVGKKAKDNDHLSFRVAKSLDTWMHAADFPGSHVVVRNPNRREIPARTLIEAAQLAAFYSRGRSQSKAAVHYTQKKYVNKPRRAAPGLVSLASFKTILVEPKIPDFEPPTVTISVSSGLSKQGRSRSSDQ